MANWIGIFLLMAGCCFLPTPARGDSIRLGEINPLTGNLALHGLEIHEGIVLAVDEINSQGGLNGRQGGTSQPGRSEPARCCP